MVLSLSSFISLRSPGRLRLCNVRKGTADSGGCHTSCESHLIGPSGVQMSEPSNFSRRKMAAAVFGIAALAYGSSGFAQVPGASSGGMEMKGSMMKGSSGSMEMKESMMKGMKEMDGMQMTGDADRDFAMMMKMHHQGAIDMAQVEMKSGKDAKMKAMAKKIEDAQRKEIKEFDDWLAKHK